MKLFGEFLGKMKRPTEGERDAARPNDGLLRQQPGQRARRTPATTCRSCSPAAASGIGARRLRPQEQQAAVEPVRAHAAADGHRGGVVRLQHGSRHRREAGGKLSVANAMCSQHQRGNSATRKLAAVGRSTCSEGWRASSRPTDTACRRSAGTGGQARQGAERRPSTETITGPAPEKGVRLLRQLFLDHRRFGAHNVRHSRNREAKEVLCRWWRRPPSTS